MYGRPFLPFIRFSVADLHTALQSALKQLDCNDSQLTRSADDSNDCLGAKG